MSFGETLLYWGTHLYRAFDKARPNLTELGTEAIQTIVLISSTALGDAVLSTPAITAIRQTYPRAKIILVLNPAYLDVFKHNTEVNVMVPYAGKYAGFWRTVRSLRQHKPDIVCILHGNEPQATPLAVLSGARFIFKLPNTSRFRCFLTNDEHKTWDDFTHGIVQRLSVVELAGASINHNALPPMHLAVHEQEKAEVIALLEKISITDSTPVIALQAGASTFSRRWSPDNFIALSLRLLSADPNLALLLTGSPAEAALCEKIAQSVRGKFPQRTVFVSAGKLPMRLLPALLQRVRLLVTGDTGPMHVAIAVKTPVLALFAVSDWRRSGPFQDYEKHRIIQKARTCDPCFSKDCPYQEPLCMAQITVDEVFEAIGKIQ